MQPTAEQLRVIWHRGGPLLVLAVAGSGKTSCLLWLISRLVYEGFTPDSILMTTFSRRSAEDMAVRGAALGIPAGVDFRTLHSLGFEMARSQYGLRAATVPQKWQLARVIRSTLDDLSREVAALGSVLTPGEVLREIDAAKAALVWPEEWCAWNGARFPGYVEWATDRTRDPIDFERADIVMQCYAALEAAGARPEEAGFRRDEGQRWLTFNDQVAVPARAILRAGPADAWVRYWQERFAWVLVDEVQDNNLAQWTLCEFLARARNIVCVGDDQQAVFLWSGARPELMRVFLERHPDAAILPLSFNFRSGQAILDLANKTLAHAADRLYLGMLRRGRADADLASVRVETHETPDAEAEGIVDELRGRLDGQDGVAPEAPDHFAVLGRTKASLGPVELWCIRAGIPYRIAGSSFFARGEIRVAVAYLALVLDEEDEAAFARAITAPTRFLGREFLDKFPTLKLARAASAKLGRWAPGVRGMTRAVQEVRVKLRDGLAAALAHVFERVGVRRFFRDEDADEEEATEVDEACAALLHCASTLGDPKELVRFAKSMAATGRESPDEQPELVGPRVTLSTIHKAKGLEWPTVFLLGCTGGLLPLRRAPLPEERRLFYVATTRAREAVRLSWTKRSVRGKPQRPSLFLVETGLAEDIPDDEDAETVLPAAQSAPDPPPALESVDIADF